MVDVKEKYPDLPEASRALGDISLAQVKVTLTPFGPGGSVGPVDCSPVSVAGSGYATTLTVQCDFDTVPVNTYTVETTVWGSYYTGYGEDVLTVYDSSLGFATGGGWFYWPETGDRTNFGFTMKYNRKGQRVQGSLLLIRHMNDDTIHWVKSNALYGLAVGEFTRDSYGWASFSGKSTYMEPGWDEPIGNRAFKVFVEDRNEPGSGVDQFVRWEHRQLGKLCTMPRYLACRFHGCIVF